MKHRSFRVRAHNPDAAFEAVLNRLSRVGEKPVNHVKIKEVQPNWWECCCWVVTA